MSSKRGHAEDGWIFDCSAYYDSSDDEADKTKSSTDAELAKELDLSTREDNAVFKPTPWTIAKLNAASKMTTGARKAGNAPVAEGAGKDSEATSTNPSLKTKPHPAPRPPVPAISKQKSQLKSSFPVRKVKDVTKSTPSVLSTPVPR